MLSLLCWMGQGSGGEGLIWLVAMAVGKAGARREYMLKYGEVAVGLLVE